MFGPYTVLLNIGHVRVREKFIGRLHSEGNPDKDGLRGWGGVVQKISFTLKQKSCQNVAIFGALVIPRFFVGLEKWNVRFARG